MSSPLNWPEDPVLLARIAADVNQPRSRRDEALHRFDRVVRDVAGAMPRRFPVEIVDAAANRLLLRVANNPNGWLDRFQPGQPQFRNALVRILRCRCIDELRTQRAQRIIPEDHDEPEPQPEDESSVGEDVLRGAVRDILDEIAWAPEPRRNAIDYFAVLLLHLRLSLAGRGRSSWRRLARNGLLAHRSFAEFVAWCLEWRPEEAGRRFRPELPPLGELWSVLTPALELPPHLVTAETVCCTLTEHLRPPAAVALDQWRKWLQRARDTAREEMGEEQWREYFAVWLPPLTGSPPRQTRGDFTP